MLKKLFIGWALLLAVAGIALADVEVNSADKAALDSIKDIGPKISVKIIAERDKGGKFKDWDDLVKRVKGVGPKNSIKMSQSGLTVNGKAKPNAPAVDASQKSDGAKMGGAKDAASGSERKKATATDGDMKKSAPIPADAKKADMPKTDAGTAAKPQPKATAPVDTGAEPKKQ